MLDKTPKCTAGFDLPRGGLVTPDTKRQHTGKVTNSTPSADNLSGTLIYMGTKMMPSVNEPNLQYTSVHLATKLARPVLMVLPV
jgi:hypothetical protein